MADLSPLISKTILLGEKTNMYLELDYTTNSWIS
jgi:hypothetical protein